MKGIAVHEVILTIGIVVISATLLATQVPAMVDDIQASLSKESVKERARELANLLSIVTASPGEAKLTHSFPAGKSYSVVIKDGYVDVSSGSDRAAAKTLAFIPEFRKDNVQALTITKASDGAVRVE